MEPSYNQMGQPESSSPRPNFASYSPHLSMNMGMGQMIHLQQPSYFSQMGQPEPEFHHQGSAVKNEGSAGKRPRFQNYPFAVREALSNDCDLGVAVGGNRGNNANTTDTTDNSHGNNNCSSVGCSEVEAMKAKIIAHPHYSNLLQAYTDCQKVGAPPDVVSRLSAMMNEFETKQRSFVGFRDASNDPELDQFMEAYCDMLVKYREELTRPVEEAMEFMRRIESQLNILTNGRALLINSETLANHGDHHSTELTLNGQFLLSFL